MTTSGREVSSGWFTHALVAWRPDTGRDLRELAEDMWAYQMGNNYQPLKVTGQRHSGQPITQNGRTGYKITGQVTVSGIEGVKGDDVTVVVVENADMSQSVLLTGFAIGDSRSSAEVQAIWASLTVS